MRYHEIMSEQAPWDGPRYVIKQDRTYRTFVGDGQRWSAREKDGEIFSGYDAVMAKIAELRARNPKLKCFSQVVE